MTTQPEWGNHIGADGGMQRLLTELAEALLPLGVTPGQFSEFAKHAFVRAAARTSRFRNGKINQSRVAVVTGLNRADVKRLLRQDRFPHQQHLSRAARVVTGWLSDQRFLDSQGRPRQLPIKGSGASF